MNRAPVISGDPATAVVVGQAYSFKPSASDPDGDALVYSAQNLPSWASFNPSTGRLSGTPGPGSVGTYNDVTIGVSDGATITRLAPYAISVTQPVAQPLTHTVRLRWTAPTTNTDGTPLVDLAGMRVSYGQTSGSYDFTLVTGSPAIESVEIQGLTQGTWYFAIKAINSRSVESEFSEEKNKTLP